MVLQQPFTCRRSERPLLRRNSFLYYLTYPQFNIVYGTRLAVRPISMAMGKMPSASSCNHTAIMALHAAV